jgi:transposase
LRHGARIWPFKAHGNVDLPNAKEGTLMSIFRQKVEADSVVHTDTSRNYNLLDVSEFKHYRINHCELFANMGNHINGIENFWN